MGGEGAIKNAEDGDCCPAEFTEDEEVVREMAIGAVVEVDRCSS